MIWSKSIKYHEIQIIKQSRVVVPSYIVAQMLQSSKCRNLGCKKALPTEEMFT